MNTLLYTLVITLLFVFFGLVLFRLILHYLPKFISAPSASLFQNIIQEAKNQRSVIFNQKTDLSKFKLSAQELDADLNSLHENLKEDQKLLNIRANELHKESNRINSLKYKCNNFTNALQKKNQNIISLKQKYFQSSNNLINELSRKSGCDVNQKKDALKKDFIDHHTLENLKNLKLIETELNDRALKKARLVLSQVAARYAPDFVWPKTCSTVLELKTGQISSILQKNPTLIENLKQLSGCEVKEVVDSNTQEINKIKFAGGFGIYRESIKLAFAQELKSAFFSMNNLDDLYKINTEKLNTKAKQLGKRAITELNLDDVHPNLQYLIGALNWRTSYQQNQWLHTMEVAVLAGMLARELKIDPKIAKLSGLLHDIGKAIDYRIEGSHAIISGDYADRYGQKKVVCDTVMSHHSDLVLETPMAFNLMAADTLSGARPGARVNIEEGYQIRLSNITEAVKKFKGVHNLAIMNGAREVHVSVNHRTVSENAAQTLAKDIAQKIESDVSYPAQIKVQVERIVESHCVA